MHPVHRLSASEQKSLITTLGKLVAIDSSRSETKVVNFCEKFLGTIGVAVEKFALIKTRPNLIWSLGRGPAILVAAHTDTVPAGENWKSDPFKMSQKKGVLLGRGVVDNKSPLAGMLVATKILQKFESELKNKIIFAAVADEERGNKFGIDFLLAQKVFPKLAAAIVPDSCGQNRAIEIAEKGVLQIKVTAFGEQGHGSLPEKSKNAIFVLKDFLRQVRQLKFARRTKLLTPTTIAVTSFHAGAATNVIPGEASATLDIRLPPSESKTKVLAKIKTLATAEERRWRVPKFRFEILSDLPSSATTENCELVKSTAAAVQKITRRKPQALGMAGFTFGGILRARGIPTVAFGPGKLEECHRANEKVRSAEVTEFAEILIELLRGIELK
ncbi:MAG: ArgE/DapE family deacylase [Patescibacteria group bacterium]